MKSSQEPRFCGQVHTDIFQHTKHSVHFSNQGQQVIIMDVLLSFKLKLRGRLSILSKGTIFFNGNYFKCFLFYFVPLNCI